MSSPPAKSNWEMTKILVRKNYVLARRSPLMLAAEYFIMPLYVTFWLAVIVLVFPDDRLTLSEVKALESELSAQIPNSCTFMGQTAFVPSSSDTARNYMISLGASCGVTDPDVALTFYQGFETRSDYELAYLENPATYYACVDFTSIVDSSNSKDFTLLYNETLTEGRYVPNVDLVTNELLSPPLVYMPAVTESSSIMAFGDNRLVDLASRLQLITNSQSPRDSIVPRPFPFSKPECEGAGCVVKFAWPQLAASVFFVTIQSFFTKLGQEKERGIKEALYLAGTSQSAYWASWAITKILDLIVPVFVFVFLLFVTQILKHQNLLLVAATLFLYMISFLSLAACMQPFFKTGMQMFVAGASLMIVFSVAYYPVRLLGIDKGWDDSVSTLFFLFPPISISHIFWEFQEADSIGVAVEVTGLVLNAIWMMPLSSILWLFLGFYFEQIVPQAHGPPIQTNKAFLFDAKWWSYRPLSGNAKVEEGEDEIPVGAFSGVKISNLVKVFKSPDLKDKKKELRAIDGLSVEFPNNQVTAVLGHNGAGKTTTIRCMTASETPTSGEITINGIDAIKNKEWVKANVGVCPQHDVLYDSLTAQEHVTLFGTMKGVIGDGVNYSSETLALVDLQDKADELVGSFSGGQKRRLSVALSLLGDPKLIVLDEPTTGMDVIARQSVWKMIEEKKKGRTIILTTHSMEEADALGDSVAVVGKGKIQAQGTSLDLKTKFGIGFHLHVVKEAISVKMDEFDIGALRAVLEKHLSASEVGVIKTLTDVGAECSFAIPRENAEKSFPALFQELHEKKAELKIEQIALSQTTLEEVFLELHEKELQEEKEREEKEKEKEKEEEKKKKKKNAKEQKNGSEDEKREAEAALTKEDIEAAEDMLAGGSGVGTFSQQVYGMMYLIVHTYQRAPTAIMWLIGNPIIFILIAGFVYISTEKESLESKAVVLPDGLFAEFPYVITDEAAALESLQPNAEDYIDRIGFNASITGKAYESRSALDNDLVARQDDLGFNFGLVFSQLSNGTQFFDGFDIELHLNASDDDYSYTREIGAMVTNAGMRDGGWSTPTYTELPKGNTVQVNASSWGAGGIMIIISSVFAYLSALYSENMARTRIKGQRVHLFVSSMGRLQYYAGFFLADTLSILIPLIMTPVILYIFGFAAVTESNLFAYFFLVIFFAPSCVAFGYFMSWFFPTIEAAQEWGQEVIGIFTAMPFFLTAFVVDASNFAHTVIGLIPGYALFRGFSVLEAEALEDNAYLTFGEIFDPKRDLFWVYFILLVDTVFYWGLVIAAEKLEAPVTKMMNDWRQKGGEVASSGAGSAIPTGGNAVMSTTLGREPDEQVSTEKTDVMSSNNDLSNKLVIQGIEQKFVMQNGKINHAVKGVFLQMPKGEVFGLLGMNGAGKTTLLQTIQGKYVPTSGDCTIDKVSCVKDMDEARKMFGICPQHDVLWDECTSREHLIAFANIRGVEKSKVEKTVDLLLKRLDVSHKANAMSSTLSGGQKRKLSIAMAVIGNPTCVFLDEPTTGLDPNTRRFVWDYIMELKKDRVVVLTTHSMEEADALCSRIGIMVNGELKTLGTPMQLKAMYGSGYRIDLKLKSGSNDNDNDTNASIVQFMKEVYGDDAIVFDSTASTSTICVFDIRRNELNFGEFFEKVEEKREAWGLLDYNINQANLDQVFKNFAKFQASA